MMAKVAHGDTLRWDLQVDGDIVSPSSLDCSCCCGCCCLYWTELVVVAGAEEEE